MIKFMYGLGATVRGWRFIAKHRSLWKFIVLPLLINLTLFCAAIYLLIDYFPQLFDMVKEFVGWSFVVEDTSKWYLWLYSKFLWFLNFIVQALFALVLGLMVFISMILLANLISSPFFDLLSEACESIYASSSESGKTFAQSIAALPAIVWVELKKVFVVLLLVLCPLILVIIPVFGSVLYLVIANSFAAILYAYDYLDFNLERHGFTFKQRYEYARRNAFTLAGAGVLVFLPLLNFVLVPGLVAGMTLHFIDSQKNDAEVA